MSTIHFGSTQIKPSRKVFKAVDRICREEGGIGFAEINMKRGSNLDVNHGRYLGCFVIINSGNPEENRLLIDRILLRVKEEGYLL